MSISTIPNEILVLILSSLNLKEFNRFCISSKWSMDLFGKSVDERIRSHLSVCDPTVFSRLLIWLLRSRRDQSDPHLMMRCLMVMVSESEFVSAKLKGPSVLRDLARSVVRLIEGVERKENEVIYEGLRANMSILNIIKDIKEEYSIKGGSAKKSSVMLGKNSLPDAAEFRKSLIELFGWSLARGYILSVMASCVEEVLRPSTATLAKSYLGFWAADLANYMCSWEDGKLFSLDGVGSHSVCTFFVPEFVYLRFNNLCSQGKGHKSIRDSLGCTYLDKMNVFVGNSCENIYLPDLMNTSNRQQFLGGMFSHRRHLFNHNPEAVAFKYKCMENFCDKTVNLKDRSRYPLLCRTHHNARARGKPVELSGSLACFACGNEPDKTVEMVTFYGVPVCRYHLKDRATLKLIELVCSQKTMKSVKKIHTDILSLS